MFITTLRDKSGNLYQLHEGYVRMFSFGIGIVRFSVSALSSVTLQAILNVQNSVMRLKNPKQAGYGLCGVRVCVCERVGV